MVSELCTKSFNKCVQYHLVITDPKYNSIPFIKSLQSQNK